MVDVAVLRRPVWPGPRATHRYAESCADRHSARACSLPHLLRHQRRSPHPRCAIAGHRAAAVADQRRSVFVRSRQPTSFARVARLGAGQTAARKDAHPRHDFARVQHRRTPRAHRRYVGHLCQPGRSRKRDRRRRLRLLVVSHVLTRSASESRVGEIPGTCRRSTSSHAATLALSWHVVQGGDMATATQPRTERFLSPFEVETPPGAEGWRNMYPPYVLFSEENREFEDNAFWIWDSMHLPEVQLPFETHTHENWIYCASVANSRIFAVPPSFGFTQRMLNGYEYVALSPVNDPKEIEARVPVFMARAGQYYQNWNPLFEEWKIKAEKLITDMAALEVVQQLPHLESDAFFQAHPGANS